MPTMGYKTDIAAAIHCFAGTTCCICKCGKPSLRMRRMQIFITSGRLSLSVETRSFALMTILHGRR